MNRRMVLGIVVLAAVAVAVWLARPGGEPSATAQAPADVESTGLPVREAALPPAAAGAANRPLLLAAASSPVKSEALPIDLHPGFEMLGTPITEIPDTDPRRAMLSRHRELESEPRDEAWAPRVESEVRKGIEDYLAALGHERQRIELPIEECRSTGCEIQAIGRQGDGVRNGVDLQLILPSLIKGRLAHEFGMEGYRLSMFGLPGRRHGVVVMVSRREDR